MRRGEVYEYIPVIPRPGQSRMRLIISAQGINEADHPVVLGLQVLDRDPGGLLSIRLAHLGWVYLANGVSGVFDQLGSSFSAHRTGELASPEPSYGALTRASRREPACAQAGER